MAAHWVRASLLLTGLAGCLAGLVVAPSARAETLVLKCKTTKSLVYEVTYDTETRAFNRRDDKISQPYRILRMQADKGDILVWGSTREGGDMLAFFGSKTMVKYFYGNGSETTDTCTQSTR